MVIMMSSNTVHAIQLDDMNASAMATPTITIVMTVEAKAERRG